MSASGFVCLAAPAAPMPAAPPPITTMRMEPPVPSRAPPLHAPAGVYYPIRLVYRKHQSTDRRAPATRGGDEDGHGSMEQVIASIGPKIHQLRRQKNLSLQQLAERAAIPAAAFHRIERNGRVPTTATLMTIGAARTRSVASSADEARSAARQAILVRADDRKRVYTSKSGL